MMLLGMKTYLALLWGVSVLSALESTSAPTAETGGINSTAEPHKAADISVAAPAETTASPTVEREETTVTYRSDSTNGSTLVAVNTVAATVSSTDPPMLHTATAVDTTAGAAHPSPNTTIFKTTAGDQKHRPSATTSTDITAPATTSATASAATVAMPSPQPMSTSKHEITSKLPPTTSPATSSQAPVFIQTRSRPSASTTTTGTANLTSEAAPVFESIVSGISPSGTELLSTSRPVSTTRTPGTSSQLPDTAASSSTAEPPTITLSSHSPVSTTSVSTTSVSTTSVSTTSVSIRPTGVSSPHATKRLPVPTTNSTLRTTAPGEVSKSPPSTKVQPCSTRGVVKHCLIAIASLAMLATVFMVLTIILCTKLSKRKYKVKKTQPAMEMMCISALLPERNHTYSRQRNPVTNGVLVIHGGADSDEDGGDNLTLSSFLPDNDRFV